MTGNVTPADIIAPWRRADFCRDLIDAAVYIATHPEVVPVPDWGVLTIPHLSEARQFGTVTLEAAA